MAIYDSSPIIPIDIATGDVSGYSSVNKFGHNPTTTAGDDIWGGGGVYPFYPTAAVAVDMVSTAAADDLGSTGAIQVIVTGLDSNWDVQSETVTMDGTTVVQLANTYVRLYRAYVYEAGTSNTNAGDITVYARATGSGVTIGDVGIQISAGAGQTQQSIYTVPAGKTAYFVKGYVGLATSLKTHEEGVFRWLVRQNGDVNGAWLVRGEAGLVNVGNSHWIYEYAVPAGPLPAKTDIRLMMASASTTFNTVAGYDLILVDN